MRVPTAVCLLLALVAVSLPTSAQDHEHDMSEGMLLIMADLPADGRTVVGDLSHFQYVLLDPDGVPFVHHDFHVDVVLNGISLYATESGHDYDGVGDIDIVFPVAGEYTVTVAVPITDGELVATYEGYVVPAHGKEEATIDAAWPSGVSAKTPATFTYSVVDADGTIIPHTDALVQVRRIADDFLVLEAHTHTHDDAMSFDYAFEKTGKHEVRIVGYTAFPDKSATVFDPVVVKKVIDVTEATYGTPLDLAQRTERPISGNSNESHAHGGKGYVTHITADPVQGTKDRVAMKPTAGPFSQVRASYVVYETPNMTLVQHTNHVAKLTGPYGTVFESSSLHEYDGVLTLMSANQALGDYTWEFSGQQGDWTDAKSYTYHVAPANLPLQAGPQFIDVTGTEQLTVAAPRSVEFFVHGPGDVPFMHSEVAFEVQDEEGMPLLRHKLHTHATGTFAFQAAMHTEGKHILRVDPFDIHGSPTPVYYGKDLMSGRALGFTPSADKEWPVDDHLIAVERVGPEINAIPAPTVFALLGLIGAAVIGTRRRE
ncbi:MAG: hypothetical protein KY455_02915 [Euryarchaeota archaeon]|nr:hypothetical protein [Euryarchaeota archaeon]